MGKGFLEAQKQRYVQEREQARAQVKRVHLFSCHVSATEAAHGELLFEGLTADTDLIAHPNGDGAITFFDENFRPCVRLSAQEATDLHPRAVNGSLAAMVSAVDPELQTATLRLESIGPCDEPG